VIIGGVATLAVTGIWIKLFPDLSRMQTFPENATRHEKDQ